MNFKRTSKFQRTNPEDYRSKLISTRQLVSAKMNRPNTPNKYACELDEKGNKIRPIRDTWWLVESESSSKKTYLLQIHMKLLLNDYEHGKDNKGQIAIYGRIECDCPSFLYCKHTPRHCKHSVELARRFFGEKSYQYSYLDNDTTRYYDEPDEWCSENYKIVEAMKEPMTEKQLKTKQQRQRARQRAEEYQSIAEKMQEITVEASREGLTFHPTNK